MNIEQAKAQLLEALSGPGGKNWGYGPAVKTLLDALNNAESTLEREREKSRRTLVQNHRLIVESMAQREVIEAVRAVAGQSEGIAGWHHNGTIAGWDEILPEVFDLDTPQTLKAVADMQAQGVEMFAAFCGEENSVFVEAKSYYRSLPDAADEFATQLRQGATK